MKKMGGDITHHVNNPQVLKDMQEYLRNPQTIKELYDALKALPQEEFYDLHEEELGEVFTMYWKLGEKPDRETNDDRMRYDIGKMMDLKRDVEGITTCLLSALENYSAPYYFRKEEQEKRLLFEKQMKILFVNILECLAAHKKKITIDEVVDLKRYIVERFNTVKALDHNELAHILSLLLQRHIYVGENTIDKAIQHLIEIHGEDISRPLLGGRDNPKDYKRDSLLFMQYGFGQISIDEMVDGFKEIIKRNNEFIQSSLQPFIPLYNWLRVVLQKTNDDEEISEQLVSANVSTDITEIKDDIDIKSIADYSYENNCLKVVLKTDKTVLEEKLRPLKKICDLSRMDNLPALNS